jgi:hypothetical protein
VLKLPIQMNRTRILHMPSTFAQVQVFRARFEYLIRDREIEGRNLTESAFEHPQRYGEVVWCLENALSCRAVSLGQSHC